MMKPKTPVKKKAVKPAAKKPMKISKKVAFLSYKKGGKKC